MITLQLYRHTDKNKSKKNNTTLKILNTNEDQSEDPKEKQVYLINESEIGLKVIKFKSRLPKSDSFDS